MGLPREDQIFVDSSQGADESLSNKPSVRLKRTRDESLHDQDYNDEFDAVVESIQEIVARMSGTANIGVGTTQSSGDVVWTDKVFAFFCDLETYAAAVDRDAEIMRAKIGVIDEAVQLINDRFQHILDMPAGRDIDGSTAA